MTNFILQPLIAHKEVSLLLTLFGHSFTKLTITSAHLSRRYKIIKLDYQIC